MINVRKAVEVTQDYFQSIQDMLGEELRDLRLEEVELSEDRDIWLVTLGYDRVIPAPQSVLGNVLKRFRREYKLFKVNAETGEVKGMVKRLFDHEADEYTIPLR